MRLPHRLSAVSLVMLAALAGCGDDDIVTDQYPDKSGQSAPADAGPCLVTAELLEEITGTPQTIEEVPSEGLAELICTTTFDDRDVLMHWSLQEPPNGRAQTSRGLRRELDDLGLKVKETDLGQGQIGWVGAGKPIGFPHSQVKALVDDDLILEVTVTANDENSPLSVSDLSAETLALARAVAAALAR